MRRRRPSVPLLIALLALFVALGGPAEAQRLIGGQDVRNRSLSVKDLSRGAVRKLQATPRRSVSARALADGAVTGAKLANSAVTSGKLAAGAVGTGQLGQGSVGAIQLAPNAVGGGHVADGSLDARDVARFAGRFRVTVPAVPPGTCWSGEPVGLAAEQAGADIYQDLVLVTPDAAWPERQLSFTVRNSANRERFVLSGCNATPSAVTPREVGFRYAVIDLP